MAFTYSDTDNIQRIYVNGVNVKENNAVTGSIISNTKPLLLGTRADFNSVHFFNGIIDEVRIFNRALSADEIKASYNAKVNQLENNFTDLTPGEYEYYAYAIDSEGNANTTETRTLTRTICTSGNYSTTCYINETITISEPLSGINNLVIQSNGKITTDAGDKVNISATNITIESGGQINVDNKGYSGGSGYNSNGNGPGKGYYHSYSGGGAGYGGYGGNGYGTGGSPYGSITQPTDLGSGGGGAYYASGGYGGGAIFLNISDTITIESGGTITADGQNDRTSSSSKQYNGGGGSGGSIYIITDKLAGSGTITADGGDGGNDYYDGGGGSGGRISLNYNTNTFSGSIHAYGGDGYGDGGAGTIYYNDQDNAETTLVINNNLSVFNGVYLCRKVPV